MKGIFCSRKGGATIRGQYFPLRTSDILAREIERKADKIAARSDIAGRAAARRRKAEAEADRRDYIFNRGIEQ